MQAETSAVTESLALLLVALFLFASPFTLSWLGLQPPWYTLYLIWLGLTVVTGLLARRWRRHAI